MRMDIIKLDIFSESLRPDWGNTAWATMAGLESPSVGGGGGGGGGRVITFLVDFNSVWHVHFQISKTVFKMTLTCT